MGSDTRHHHHKPFQRAVSDMANIEDLPDELILLILGRLERKDLANARLACRRLCDCALDAFAPSMIYDTKSVHHRQQTVEAFTTIAKYNLDRMDFSVLCVASPDSHKTKSLFPIFGETTEGLLLDDYCVLRYDRAKVNVFRTSKGFQQYNMRIGGTSFMIGNVAVKAGIELILSSQAAAADLGKPVVDDNAQ